MKEAIEKAKELSKKNSAFYHVIANNGVFHVERGALPELGENEVLVGIFKNGVKCI